MKMLFTCVLLFAATCSSLAAVQACPGYKLVSHHSSSNKISAHLKLAGAACNAYSDDLEEIILEVVYETTKRIHVKISDAAGDVYQVPESVFPRPHEQKFDASQADLKFDYKSNPFSFSVSRRSNGEVLFDTSVASLIFESQYLRLRTSLPDSPNLYGLGESTDSFRLETLNYTRTLWNYDDGVPQHRNLYGSHPVYVEHRVSGTHGVFFLNSNGMDIKIDKDHDGKQYLEYNTIGGVLDFYFMSGPSPIDVAKQYSEIAGLPTLVPYNSLGLSNCRWGYRSSYELAEVVYNYSIAGIPLETMWADIDYMDHRSIFSVDPDRFSLQSMRALADKLHEDHQSLTLMVDPATAARDYPPYHRGVDANAFLMRNGSVYHGVVWPGPTAYPDWFSKTASDYWTNEFKIFFSPDNGVDIDFLWIDMNEASNFCEFPCDDPFDWAKKNGLPPTPPPIEAPSRPLPGWPCVFQPKGTSCKQAEIPARRLAEPQRNTMELASRSTVISSRSELKHKGLPGRDLLYPKYKIRNGGGDISIKTIRTDVYHENGLALYDTHNLYGAMMSQASHNAMLARRQGKRPLVITRSTFAGAGRFVSHWLGDNASDWPYYQWTIRGILQFASIFQIPMVGSDTCGFGGDATEELCARWAMLGAFQPFYRNHNAEGSRDQEFYRWPIVTMAAKKAIDIRYRLLDYFYTALHEQSTSGTPAVNPMFYLYPHDEGTFGLDLQYFYGTGLLVAPVLEKGATSVDIYLPNDVFYDFFTHERIQGQGKTITKTNQTLTDIPLFLRGGVIMPLRVNSGMTTHDVRGEDFEILIPLGEDRKAHGTLYLDDGVSIDQQGTLFNLSYDNGKLDVSGTVGYDTDLKVVKVTVIGRGANASSEPTTASESINTNEPLTRSFSIRV